MVHLDFDVNSLILFSIQNDEKFEQMSIDLPIFDFLVDHSVF